MKRRAFVKTSLLTTLAAGFAPQSGTAAAELRTTNAGFYELRVYKLKSERQQKLVEDYFKDAAIPALNRAGVDRVGVFSEFRPQGQTKIYVWLPYNSPEDLPAVQDKLLKDTAYQEAGQRYLSAAASDPAYERIESSLLRGFAPSFTVRVPVDKPRLFELRQYEHATENAGKKKLEMFEDAGEAAIFRRLGFRPVFFGETLIGADRPNLTYMLTFDDIAGHDSHWAEFGSDPEWKKISAMPEYADEKLVCRITSTLLIPAGCSQV